MNGDPMDMFSEMDEMFARLFSQMSREFSATRPQVYSYRIVINGSDPQGGMTQIPPADSPRTSREPVAEVHQIGDEIKVITELPGTAEESIRLDVRDGILVIDAGDADAHYHTTAELPPVDTASMATSFRNGVLEVTFRNSGPE